MNLSKSLSLGIIAAFFALVLEQAAIIIIYPTQPVDYSGNLNPLLIASILIEEVVKYGVIHKSSFDITNKKAILGNALFIGLGFSLVEIIFHLMKIETISPAIFLPLSGVLFIHLLTSIIVGLLISRHDNLTGKSHLLYIIFITFLIHFAYNIMIISALPTYDFNFTQLIPENNNISFEKSDSVIYVILLFVAFLLYEMHRIIKNIRKIVSVLVK